MEVLTGHEGCKQLQVEQHTPLFPESHLKAFQLACSELIAHQTHRVPTRAGWKGLKTPVKWYLLYPEYPHNQVTGSVLIIR